MKLKSVAIQNLVTILCIALVLPSGGVYSQTEQQTTATPSTETAAKIPADQLDALVAPVALYPDPLLAQVLAASTYPLEIIQLYQWMQRHPDLKDQALADAVMKEDWDPSIQAMAGLPDVVKRLAEDIQWTTDLGNAFLAQQSDVMDAVQRMRKKADEKGNLKSGEQVKIETKVVESKEIIVIEQSNPQVVYVPSYNPTVVYGAPIYPYPPIYYPPAGYYAAGMAVSFGVGVAMGAFWGGGGWGWGCGWGGNDIDINVNNNFNRNANFNRNTNVNRSGNINSGKWQHNSQHRGGAPYGDRGTANRYGGQSRGDSLSSRQSSARQQVNRQGGNMQSSSRSSGNYGNRSSGNYGNRSNYSPSSGNRSSYSGSSSNRVGSRDMSSSRGSYSGRSSAMGSGSRSSYSGSSARSNSSRGRSSMGSRGGGGGRRG
ncbi:DUF3300 domain-containing protein [bacterium]|nr:DUF3300 domain-containing protein [bacterium]